MSQQNSWSEQSDQLLKFLHDDMKIFNWNTISKELQNRQNLFFDSLQCRNRYVEKYGLEARNEWVMEQEQQLYRLHDQNGNRWAIISQNLLGRSDNCVKNHFYSKLRKSLRTLNKIAKLYLKKQVKQIGDVVLYKLTEVTDQSLKQNPIVSKQVCHLSFEIKRNLLQYNTDQKQINNDMDYSHQKSILLKLSQFNRLYKKKPKGQKITAMGSKIWAKSQNSVKTSNAQNKDNDFEYQDDQEQQIYEKKKIMTRNSQKNIRRQKQKQLSGISCLPQNYETPINTSQLRNAEQQNQSSQPRKTLNFFIKAPSFDVQQRCNSQDLIDLSLYRQLSSKNKQPSILSVQSLAIASVQSNKKNKVQDILKAEGILQNADYRNNENENYFRRTNSARSFSMCSESSNPDMFGEGVVYLDNFKQVSQIQNQCQFFSTHQNQ